MYICRSNYIKLYKKARNAWFKKTLFSPSSSESHLLIPTLVGILLNLVIKFSCKICFKNFNLNAFICAICRLYIVEGYTTYNRYLCNRPPRTYSRERINCGKCKCKWVFSTYWSNYMCAFHHMTISLYNKT